MGNVVYVLVMHQMSPHFSTKISIFGALPSIEKKTKQNKDKNKQKQKQKPGGTKLFKLKFKMENMYRIHCTNISPFFSQPYTYFLLS